MKSIEVGACDYWVKPLSEQRLVNMWIDVVKNNIKDEEQKDIGSQKDDDRTRVVDDFDDDRTRVTDDSDDDDSDSADSVQWSTELNFLFHQALIKIGLESMILSQFFLSMFINICISFFGLFFLLDYFLLVSKPEDILEAMNVPGLELEDVESHLEVSFYLQLMF